jgi:hypothetical protein
MRVSIFDISWAAPSTVCSNEMASFAFRTAIFKPDVWADILSDIARPAASSLAELMREPVERRSIAVDMARSFRCIASLASNEAVFVLITVMINSS